MRPQGFDLAPLKARVLTGPAQVGPFPRSLLRDFRKGVSHRSGCGLSRALRCSKDSALTPEMEVSASFRRLAGVLFTDPLAEAAKERRWEK